MSPGSHSESPSPSGGLEITLHSSPPWWNRQEFEILKKFQPLTLQGDLEDGSSGGRGYSCATIQEPKHWPHWSPSLSTLTLET